MEHGFIGSSRQILSSRLRETRIEENATVAKLPGLPSSSTRRHLLLIHSLRVSLRVAMQRLLLQGFSSNINEMDCKFDQVYEPASCPYSKDKSTQSHITSSLDLATQFSILFAIRSTSPDFPNSINSVRNIHVSLQGRLDRVARPSCPRCWVFTHVFISYAFRGC